MSGRVTRIEMVDGAGTRNLNVKSDGRADTGSIFFSLEQAKQAYEANRNGEAMPQTLVDRFNTDGIIVHDIDCDWW